MSTKEVLTSLEDQGFYNFHRVNNINNRPKRYYYTALNPQGIKYFIKIVTLKKDEEIKTDFTYGKIIKALGIKEYSIIKIGNYRVTIVRFVDGFAIQKYSYGFINKKFNSSNLVNYIIAHYNLMKQLNNVPPQTEQNSLFLIKLKKYIKKFNKDNQEYTNEINTFYRNALRNFKLSSKEKAFQHGDFYGSNILWSDKYKNFILIDWDGLSYTSCYFDLATFIAKHLKDIDFVKKIYKNILPILDNKSRENFNFQILIALLKEYKNISVLDKNNNHIKNLNDYKIHLVKLIMKNIFLTKKKLIFS